MYSSNKAGLKEVCAIGRALSWFPQCVVRRSMPTAAFGYLRTAVLSG